MAEARIAELEARVAELEGQIEGSELSHSDEHVKAISVEARFFMLGADSTKSPLSQPQSETQLRLASKAKLKNLLQQLNVRKESIEDATKGVSTLEEEITASVTQAQISVQEKIGALKTLLLTKEESLLGHIQSFEEGNFQQVCSHQSMLEASQKRLLSCINATSVLVNGSSFALVHTSLEAHTANSECLATHETTISSEFINVKAHKQQCSFSQTVFPNEFIGCLTELYAQKATPRTPIPIVNSENRQKQIGSLKAEIAHLQTEKSEIISAAKYLEATAQKKHLDKLRYELEGLQAESGQTKVDFKKEMARVLHIRKREFRNRLENPREDSMIYREPTPFDKFCLAPKEVQGSADPAEVSKEAESKQQLMQLEYMNIKYEYMNPVAPPTHPQIPSNDSLSSHFCSNDNTQRAPESGKGVPAASGDPPPSARSKKKASAELEAYQHAQTSDKCARGNILSLFFCESGLISNQ